MIDVANADEAATAIVAAGGSIVIPKASIPGIGQLVTFKDTEGNVMAVLESVPASRAKRRLISAPVVPPLYRASQSRGAMCASSPGGSQTLLAASATQYSA